MPGSVNVGTGGPLASATAGTAVLGCVLAMGLIAFLAAYVLTAGRMRNKLSAARQVGNLMRGSAVVLAAASLVQLALTRTVRASTRRLSTPPPELDTVRSLLPPSPLLKLALASTAGGNTSLVAAFGTAAAMAPLLGLIAATLSVIGAAVSALARWAVVGAMLPIFFVACASASAGWQAASCTGAGTCVSPGGLATWQLQALVTANLAAAASALWQLLITSYLLIVLGACGERYSPHAVAAEVTAATTANAKGESAAGNANDANAPVRRMHSAMPAAMENEQEYRVSDYASSWRTAGGTAALRGGVAA